MAYRNSLNNFCNEILTLDGLDYEPLHPEKLQNKLYMFPNINIVKF